MNSRIQQIARRELHRHRGPLVIAAVCMVGFSLMELLAPWPIKIILDHVLLEKPLPSMFTVLQLPGLDGKIGLLLMMGLSILLIAAFTGMFAYFRVSCSVGVGHHMVHALRLAVLAHVQRLSLSFHARSRTGELLSKVLQDTRALKGLFSELTLNAVSHVLTVVGMCAIMIALNWQLTLILLVTVPVLVWTLLSLNNTVREIVSQQRKREGKMTARMNELLQSIPLIQAFGREDYEQGKFVEDSTKDLQHGMGAARTEAGGNFAVMVVSAVGTTVTVVFGSWQVLQGFLSPGELLIFISYVRKAYKPFRNMAKIAAQLSRAMVSVARLGELFSLDAEIEDRDDPIPVSVVEGDIRFDGVSFGYDAGRDVLDQLTLHITPGQHVALVGASGAGKSTIVSLLLRLYQPREGTISIDGVDISRYRRDSLLEHIGIVLQDSFLFGTTIRENIAYGKPDASDPAIEAAARQAHAHAFIVDLPDGYDTVIGERGCSLSGGQRQRIGLARALLKQPAMLILDEPTSAVDAISASMIWDAITAMDERRTIVVIAHHLVSMHQFDQIFVLHDGKVVEHGRHHSLLALKGYYFELVQHQSVGP